MQAVGLHSALAIRRERKRRKAQQNARDRRYSSQSVGIDGSRGSFTPRGSITSTDGRTRLDKKSGKGLLGTKVMGNISMLHIGVVFTVLGLFLIVSCLIPGYLTTDWDDMLGLGVFFLIVGIFLVVINRMLTKKEEELLFQDVQSKLSRTQSGHKIMRDVESGRLSPRREKGQKDEEEEEDDEEEDDEEEDGGDNTKAPGETTYYDAISIAVPNGDVHLDKIVEESEPCEPTENGKAVHVNVYDSQESTSLSPSSPSETKELLQPKHTSRV